MKKTLHIFDLDDTLTVTPTFSDLMQTDSEGYVDAEKSDENVQEYIVKLKSKFWDRLSKNVAFKKSGDFIVVYNADTKSPMDVKALDYFPERKWDRIFSIHNGYLILEPYPGFHSDPNTIGRKLNEPVHDIYKSVDNKMILTGRAESLRNLIESNFKEIGIVYPNYGFKMYPKGKSIREYKTDVILNTIEENGWNEIHFYEDRVDWLHHAEGAVKERYPELKFITHHISNVKDAHKL